LLEKNKGKKFTSGEINKFLDITCTACLKKLRERGEILHNYKKEGGYWMYKYFLI